jgi:hypothetical protein
MLTLFVFDSSFKIEEFLHKMAIWFSDLNSWTAKSIFRCQKVRVRVGSATIIYRLHFSIEDNQVAKILNDSKLIKSQDPVIAVTQFLVWWQHPVPAVRSEGESWNNSAIMISSQSREEPSGRTRNPRIEERWSRKYGCIPGTSFNCLFTKISSFR